jgi:hypothetical protein
MPATETLDDEKLKGRTAERTALIRDIASSGFPSRTLIDP